MKPILKFVVYILLTGVIIFASCKKEKPAASVIPVPQNHPPVANAGKDTTLLRGNAVTLDGSGSTDPDNNITSYAWTKISGPSLFNISNANPVKAQLTNLVEGTYQFELKVTDAGGLFSKDSVQVTIAPNYPPVANAGADTTIVLPVNTVILDGSGSTDPDNNITSYVWTKISGPSSFNISNPNAAQTQVTQLVQGIYQFELKVSDAGGLFSKDTLQLTVNNTLSGSEFIFQSLTWQLFSDGFAIDEEIYISIDPSNSFSIATMATLPVEVSIQFDTSSVWMNIPQWNWYPNGSIPSNNGYIWYFPTYPYSATPYFLIDNYPFNYQLVGRNVKVKVKFL